MSKWIHKRMGEDCEERVKIEKVLEQKEDGYEKERGEERGRRD